MEQSNSLEQLLRGLSAPRRNHYFYGKLMDVCHFEMEQTYVNHKRWLINQQSLGSGVLCGLNVRENEGKLWVEPGMAIDGFGREIIMPVRAGIDPWTLTDDCGKTEAELSKEERHKVTLLICYKECLTDYMPVLVSDCGNEEDAAAATLVETFQLAIREGAPDSVRPALDPRCCRALSANPDQDQPPEPDSSTDPADPKDTLGGIERLRSNLCECADDPCPTPQESCVVLAVVELLPGGRIGRIDQCRYRQRLYSNQVLLDLILCLAARLDACCKEPDGQDLIPPKVESVQVYDIHNDLLAELADPAEIMSFERKQLVGSVRVLFTQPLLPASVVTGGVGDDPGAQSFLVMKNQAGLVSGTLKFEDQRTVRWFPDTDAVEVGAYTVRLFGDGDVNTGRPPITSADSVRLDGEPDDLPSGDDVEGGIFAFRFRITEETEPKEPPKVAAVQVLDINDDVLAELADPSKVMTFERSQSVGLVRVVFTQPILPDSVVTGVVGDNPGAQSFLVEVTQGGLVPGTVKFENQRTVRWEIGPGGSQVGLYTVRLYGDGDKTTGRPPITSIDGVRLDGDPTGLPSGDDVEGGIFAFRFRITDEVEPEEPPKVASVTLMSRENGVLANFGSPGEVPEINVADQPRSIRVEFTSGITLKSLVAGDDPDDPRPPNFLLTEVEKGPVRGRLIVEQPDRARWAADDEPLTTGAYTLSLFGDPDQSGRTAITGIKGQRLDGEPGKTFPSGNDTEGGLFQVKFKVIIKRGPGE